MWKRSVKVKRINNQVHQTVNETLVVELPFRLSLNDKLILDTTYIPTLENELAIGYLLSHFQVNEPKDLVIKKSDSNMLNCQAELVPISTHEFSPAEHAVQMTPLQLFHLTSQFQEHSFLYKDTSITHSAALADIKKVHLVTQDLHMANALDKLRGSVALGSCPNAPILLVSGKIDRPLIQKALQLGVEMIVSRLSPTQAAYDLATQYNLTLVGFARGVRMSVYVDSGRLK